MSCYNLVKKKKKFKWSGGFSLRSNKLGVFTRLFNDSDCMIVILEKKKKEKKKWWAAEVGGGGRGY